MKEIFDDRLMACAVKSVKYAYTLYTLINTILTQPHTEYTNSNHLRINGFSLLPARKFIRK